MSSQQTALETKGTQSEAGAPVRKSENLPRSAQEAAVYVDTGRISVQKEKPRYKTIPEDRRVIPPGRFAKVIGHLEAVLLEISTDGRTTANPFDWKPTIPTLQAWADHLRSALKELTK